MTDRTSWQKPTRKLNKNPYENADKSVRLLQANDERK